jgi:predicted O-linked N-acetylglucosamine transferase (SPINDLY family)
MAHAHTLASRTDQARRQWQIGQTHAQAGRWKAAVHAHRTASRLAPNDAVYALNHARALLALGEIATACDEASRAFRLDPCSWLACQLAAECMMRLSRFEDAVQTLRALHPQGTRNATHHALLGSALQKLRRMREAIAAYFDALALDPSQAQMHYNLGLCFADLDLKREAAHCFHTTLLLGAGDLEISTRGLACYYERDACQWEQSEPNLALLNAAVRALADDAQVATTPFVHAVLGADPMDQLRAARSCSRYTSKELRPLPLKPSDWQPGTRRLRVGYVSSDFHHHATAILMAEMLERHDRERFEIRLYSHGAPDGSAMRTRLEAACDVFVDVQRCTDREIAERIRDDGVDLLVDLKGYTRDNRLCIFAYRPAPLQVGFLGFPGTTGADCIDYIIGDEIVTPLDHASAYSEKIAQMPVCYQPNDRLRPLWEAPTRASQYLPQPSVVLCGFNQPYKISPEVLDSWCRLLHAVPEAVLWLLEWSHQALPSLKLEAAKRGIDPARLIGAGRVGSAEHIARLRLADVFLDTWPCNAHTTASDALWAGVPIVTRIGQTFASRVAASLLNAVGLPELVCADTAEYERTAIALATDPNRRAALRDRLQGARGRAPLFDTDRYTRDIESLYLRMAQRHALGLAPDHLGAVAEK